MERYQKFFKEEKTIELGNVNPSTIKGANDDEKAADLVTKILKAKVSINGKEYPSLEKATPEDIKLVQDIANRMPEEILKTIQAYDLKDADIVIDAGKITITDDKGKILIDKKSLGSAGLKVKERTIMEAKRSISELIGELTSAQLKKIADKEEVALKDVKLYLDDIAELQGEDSVLKLINWAKKS